MELLYKDRRLDGETPLRQTQLVALHLLDVLKRVCEENHMRYWLAFGTLLGAVRDGKMIPWDDDVDVFMMRDDVRKLAKIADKVFPHDVIWQDPARFPRLGEVYFARLRDAYSTIIEPSGNCPKRIMDHLGIPLDIFILRPVRGRWLVNCIQRIRGPLEWRYRLWRDSAPVTLISLVKVWLVGIAHYCVDGIFWLRTIWPIGRKYYLEDNALAQDSKLLFPAKWFDVACVKLFEDEEYRIPNNAEGCCHMMYGDDYMTPKVTKNTNRSIIYLPTTPCCNNRAMQYPCE